MTETPTHVDKDADLAAVRAELANTITANEQLEYDAARLRTQIRELTGQRTAVQEELDALKTRVRDTATRLAQAHDWCAVVDEALIEMGLQPRAEDITVRIQVTGYIERTVSVTSAQDALDEAREVVGISTGDRHELYHESFVVTDVDAEIADN